MSDPAVTEPETDSPPQLDPVLSPLPVPGLEYWGLEATVRFSQLAQYAQEHEVHAEVLLAGWTGTISGKVYWYTFDEDLPSDDSNYYRRGKTVLCINAQDINTDRGKAVYLRVISAEGADERRAAIPGDSLNAMDAPGQPNTTRRSSSLSSSSSSSASSSSSDMGALGTALTVATVMSMTG